MNPAFRALIFRCIPLSAYVLVGLGGCASSASTPDAGPAQEAAVASSTDTATSGAGAADAATVSGTVAISAAPRTPLPTPGLGTSYWSWSPTYGNGVAGTETQILALKPFVLRAGGYNNDTNSPDNFDNTQVDLAMTYAQAINADLIIQVPLLAADKTGAPATADTAAAMVSYANITKQYGVKYFSIGNEPDLYPDATGSTKGIPGYTAAAYCASAQLYAAAMKAVDPTIKIVGPDLSWKYQSGANDWLTPILTTCGSVFDIVTIHRYPLDPTLTTIANAAADAPKLRGVIAHVQAILQSTGNGSKPLAITECNITWDGTPAKSILPASPGTVPAGLWAADTFGVGLESGLWASIFWSTREGWTLGLFAPGGGTPSPQPEYWALDLYATHFGPTLLQASTTAAGVRAYASRNLANDGTQLIVVNWNDAPAKLTFNVERADPVDGGADIDAAVEVDATATIDGAASIDATVGDDATIAAPSFVLPPLSVGAIEIPDIGTASAWTYGETQHQSNVGPQPLLGM